ADNVTWANSPAQTPSQPMSIRSAITMPETTPVIEVATDIITSPAPFQLLRIPYLEVWVGPLRRATCLFALPQDEITLRSALGVRLPHIVKMRSIVCDTIRLCVWC